MVVKQPLSVLVKNARKISVGGNGNLGGSGQRLSLGMHGGDDEDDDDDDDVRHLVGSDVITLMSKTNSDSSSGTGVFKPNNKDKKNDLEKLSSSSNDKQPGRHRYATFFTHQFL